MEKKPVRFGYKLRPFCPVCFDWKYMENPDGNKNAYCGNCGTALDWDHAENISTGEISKIERYRHCENCKYFAVAEIGLRGAIYGRCTKRKGISNETIRTARDPACKLFEKLMEDD